MTTVVPVRLPLLLLLLLLHHLNLCSPVAALLFPRCVDHLVKTALRWPARRHEGGFGPVRRGHARRVFSEPSRPVASPSGTAPSKKEPAAAPPSLGIRVGEGSGQGYLDKLETTVKATSTKGQSYLDKLEAEAAEERQKEGEGEEEEEEGVVVKKPTEWERRSSELSYLDSLTRYSDDARILSAPERFYPTDWLRNLIVLPWSKSVRAMRSHLVVNTLVAIVVAFAHQRGAMLLAHARDKTPVSVVARGLYATLRRMPSIEPATPMIHQLSGAVLGVLLAFRTSQSYERFWAGRKLWADVANSCRNMGRMAAANAGDERYIILRRHLMAFPVALRQHLRGERLYNEFERILKTSEVNELADADNMPWALTMSLSLIVADMRVDLAPGSAVLWDKLDDQIRRLTEIIAHCEMIAGTPVPLEYSQHTSRFLSLWTLSLPLVLIDYVASPWGVAGLTLLTSWLILGVEYIGHVIEEPFGLETDNRAEMLPLRRYTDNIILDLAEENRITRRALKSSRLELTMLQKGKNEEKKKGGAAKEDKQDKDKALSSASAT